MFESFYASFWQHPLLLWIVPVGFLFVLPRRFGWLMGYLWVFTFETIVDPLCTGPLVGWLDMSDATATAVMVTFVLLGDLRFFWLTETVDEKQRNAGGVGRAIAWTFVVPLAAALLIVTLPKVFDDARNVFLAYELMFLVLATTFRFVILPKRQLSAETRRWLFSISEYVMLYYALWASADVLIMSGLDLGYALRVVPNVLYYGIFLPFVYWTAPQSLLPRPQREAPA